MYNPADKTASYARIPAMFPTNTQQYRYTGTDELHHLPLLTLQRFDISFEEE
jgi:hypothetical protein